MRRCGIGMRRSSAGRAASGWCCSDGVVRVWFVGLPLAPSWTRKLLIPRLGLLGPLSPLCDTKHTGEWLRARSWRREMLSFCLRYLRFRAVLLW